MQFLRNMRNGNAIRLFETAFVGLQLTAHQRKQTRFARTICAGNADLLAAIQRERGFSEQQPCAAANGDVGEGEHREWLRATDYRLIRSIIMRVYSGRSPVARCR